MEIGEIETGKIVEVTDQMRRMNLTGTLTRSSEHIFVDGDGNNHAIFTALDVAWVTLTTTPIIHLR